MNSRDVTLPLWLRSTSFWETSDNISCGDRFIRLCHLMDRLRSVATTSRSLLGGRRIRDRTVWTRLVDRLRFLSSCFSASLIASTCPITTFLSSPALKMDTKSMGSSSFLRWVKIFAGTPWWRMSVSPLWGQRTLSSTLHSWSTLSGRRQRDGLA